MVQMYLRQYPIVTEEEAARKVNEELSDPVYRNDKYQATLRKISPSMIHLSIKRVDKQPIHDWRDLQEIKNQLIGPENEAVELYPAESRRVDTANQFHLWAVIDPKYRFPFGYQERLIMDEDPLSGAKQRSFKK